MERFVIFELPHKGTDREFRFLLSNPAFLTSWVKPQDYRGGAQVIILPGSGRTVDDLDYLRHMGGAEKLRQHLASGGVVVGVCGGYQILGERVLDPFLTQGERKETEGLGYLPVTTLFGRKMLSCRTTARMLVGAGEGGLVVGEERRAGIAIPDADAASKLTEGRFLTLHEVEDRHFHEPRPRKRTIKITDDASFPWAPGREKFDGLVSRDRKIWGSYLHLVLQNEAFLRTLFATLT
jgi:adenosylcobyric acid synthase